jgi:hypothetical protein
MVPILFRCFAVSPAPSFSLRGAVGHGVLRSVRRAAFVATESASFTLRFPGSTVGGFLDRLAVLAGGLVGFGVAFPSWRLPALLRAAAVWCAVCVSRSVGRCWANPALNRTLRDKAAQRRLAPRWGASECLRVLLKPGQETVS